jgi:threonine dehydratase
MLAADAISRAHSRIAPYAHRTPVMTSRAIDELAGGPVHFKCENLQRVGAFKFRGAMNAILQLSVEQKRAGVVTHSSGNHAQAVALAGRLTGTPVCVVMPHTAPAIKRLATEGYGARVESCEPTVPAREAAVAALIERHGYTLVHPYDDWNVIAGAGTAAWELHDQVGELDFIIAPVGGGGLISGTALAVQERGVATKVIAAEPLKADDAKRSIALGEIQPSINPKTCCDGLRTSLGKKNFGVIRAHVEKIAVATEGEILDAMRLAWERLKVIIEPSSAVPLAVLLNGEVKLNGRRAGVILTGGNVDLDPMFMALRDCWLE